MLSDTMIYMKLLGSFRIILIYVQELTEITDYLEDKINHITKPIQLGYPTILELHGCYTREQLLVIFGKRTATTMGSIPQPVL